VTAPAPAVTAGPSARRAPHLLALAAIVLAGALPRFWRLALPGLTSDEAFSWRLTGYPIGEMLRRAALDVHPPLFYLALSAWRTGAGESVVALRGFSVLMGLIAIALVWLLVEEAARLDVVAASQDDRTRVRAGTAAFLAAAATAVHATQVLQSRNARMYALGTVLAAASAWTILRAMRAGDRRLAWWALWGLIAAAAVETHYYLAFTIAAEVGWAAVEIARGRAGLVRWRELVTAAIVGGVALAPWAPAFWRQARQVRAEYWIPPATTSGLADGIARWALGLDAGRAALPIALLVVASLAACLGTGRVARFFVLQAAAPWILGLAISAVSGRPIVLDRYMLFAQLFLLAAWSVVIARVPSSIPRTAAAAALLGVLLAGLAGVLRAFPVDPPAMANAARFLKRQAGAQDLVVVESPRALNKMRYYAGQAGGERLDIRCALPERIPLSPHVSHVVSLADGDSIAAGSEFTAGGDTVWIGREATAPPAAAPPGWTITYARLFEGGEDTRFGLVRYQRAATPR